MLASVVQKPPFHRDELGGEQKKRTSGISDAVSLWPFVGSPEVLATSATCVACAPSHWHDRPASPKGRLPPPLDSSVGLGTIVAYTAFERYQRSADWKAKTDLWLSTWSRV